MRNVAEEADERLVREALAIARAAQERGVRLRLLGALAIHLHSAGWEALEARLERLGDAPHRFTDMDFAAYGRERHAVRDLFEERLGFRTNVQALLFHGHERLLYRHPTQGYRVDVFFDRLRFSHILEFGPAGRGRLDVDFPTLGPADLLLSKLQIHRFTDKDAKDVILLLRAHPVLPGKEEDAINATRVVDVLSEDWGFWKDATTNLDRVRGEALRLRDGGKMDGQDAADVVEKATTLLRLVNEAPKGRAWYKGQRKLANRQWWEDVEEVVR